jgi:hypothetical protein
VVEAPRSIGGGLDLEWRRYLHEFGTALGEMVVAE